MTTIYIKKTGLVIHPLDELAEMELSELSDGEYKCELTRQRNLKFLRKFFALLNVAFKAWDPPEIGGYFGPAKKSFDRFRKDLVILAGYYYTTVDIEGNVHLEAESISFANMDDIEFEKVYSSVVDVILQKVLAGYTRADLDEQVNKILGFC